MGAWLDLQSGPRSQKLLTPSVVSWPPSTPGRLTPMTPRREHSVGSWREPQQRGKRRRGAVRRDRRNEGGDSRTPAPYRHFGGMPHFLIAPSKWDTSNRCPDAPLVRRLQSGPVVYPT
jgi:hypothetical protein